MSEKSAGKVLNLGLVFTINWVNFDKIATSFDFTLHHFDRLTFLVLTNCYTFFPCPDCGIAFDTKQTLFKHIREFHKREPSLCAFTCGHCNSIFTTSVTCEMFINSGKQLAAMRVRKVLGLNRHFVITEPRKILLFRLQQLSMKLSGPLFHRFRQLYQP